MQIAFLQGAKVELNFAEVMMRRLTITGSTLRPQSDQAKARIAEIATSHPEAATDVAMMLDFLAATTPQRGIVR